MKTLRQLLLGGGLLVCVFQAWNTLRPSAPEKPPALAVQPMPEPPANHGPAEDAMVEGHQALARVANLEKLKVQLDRRKAAAEQAPVARQRLLDAKRAPWSELIHRHWKEYQTLHAKAGASPRKETPCTICDDSFLRMCLLCDKHSNGKCAECRGAGRLATGDICPPCSATGVCFLCAGAGKMPCPFCDQRGMIYFDRPPPSFVPVPL